MHLLLAVGSGLVVGLSLGVIGGGGSMLAVPLLLYVVGIADPHVAIGTSAVVVGVNALVNLLGHWRRGNVNWRCAVLFATAGVVGSAAGSQVGKSIDGQRLLLLFAFAMAAAGLVALRPRSAAGTVPVRIDGSVAARLLGLGLLTGVVAGLLGIGGGIMAVPAILLATGMPIVAAIGSSLLAVSAFGFTTATNYALSGLVDWAVAAQLIAGGVAGGAIGVRAATRLAAHRRWLERLFAAVVLLLALSVAVRALTHTGH